MNKILFYLEGNVLILYSNLGILKIKSQSLIEVFAFKHFYYSIHNTISVESILKDVFILINYGYAKKYRLRGMGYMLKTAKGALLKFRLRYSHVLYRFLPFNLLTYAKAKKRKYYTIFGIERELIHKYLLLWSSFRQVNIYTKKGIFMKYKKIVFKERAKKRR